MSEQAQAPAVPAKSLSAQYAEILAKANQINEIPSFRPDLKVTATQEVAALGFELTGQVIAQIELQAQQIKLLMEDIEHGRQLLAKAGLLDEESES